MITDNLNYGIIGNGASGALISKDGSVDWLCLPHFASPSVFASILDSNAGSLGIEVQKDVSIKQSYLENTNILKTHFETDEWAFEILDFMPRYQKVTGSYYYPPELTRIIKPLRGTPEFEVQYNPRLEYSKDETITHNKGTYLISILENEEQYDALYLYTNIPFDSIINREKITLSSTVFITISYNEKLDQTDLEKAWYDFDLTKAYWLNWVQRTKEFSYYNKEIRRSALTLKLLSYDKTGAIIAALTTSLPETIGEVRNWDYRFCWIRDSSMVIKILSQLGHRKIVRRFIDYIIDLIPEKDEKLQIMYGIHSEQILTEETLEHLSGYHNSKPVRIGNDA
ncbi:MAG: glycoside hydrolase family 15 protein, partial [Flavobacteriaceae bacterium]